MAWSTSNTLSKVELVIPIFHGFSAVASETELDVWLVRSKCALVSAGVQSEVELEKTPLTDIVSSFWLLTSVSDAEGGQEIFTNRVDNPTLNKVPFKGASELTLDILLGAASQHYHSFSFNESVDAYTSFARLQQEKNWAHDQHNNHLAVLAKKQKAIHVYDLNSEVEDIIYSLQADEFESAVGLAFADGRVDVFIPTVQASGGNPLWFFLFNLAQRKSGAYLPYLYSFNIDETSVDGLVLYSKAAAESKVAFDESFGVSGKVLLEEAVYIPVKSEAEFVEDFYFKGRVSLGEDRFLRSSVAFEPAGLLTEVDLGAQPWGVWGKSDLLPSADFMWSECFLMVGSFKGCESKCKLNVLNSNEQVRSKVTFASPYQFGLECRITAIGNYLLIGLMSNIYWGSLEDPDTVFYLMLFDRNTFKCIWCKPLRTSRVTGTAMYDGWLWEDIKIKEGFTHIFTEGRFEVELFDCFGEPRIALARYGHINAPFTEGTVWEEYDINLENPCNIHLEKLVGSGGMLYPNGFVFKRRDPYDLPTAIAAPKNDYLCFIMRGKTDISQGSKLEMYQRDAADEYYTRGGYADHSDFSWLVALRREPSCALVKSEVSLNIDYSYLPSKALLIVPDPFVGASVLLGQVDLQDSLIKIIQSKLAFEDSNLLQSKVFMDDFLVRSSVEFIDNKELCFYDRCVVGVRALSDIAPTDISGIIESTGAIVRIGDGCKAYHSMSLYRQVFPGYYNAYRASPAVIIGNAAYYIVNQLLYNWEGPVPPYDKLHHFLWEVNVNTYIGTHQLPRVLYHEKTGIPPDEYDIWSAAYLIELEKNVYSSTTLLIYLNNRIMYVSNDDGVYGIAVIWFDLKTQEFYPISYILPEYTKIVSIATDGIYLYVLGYKSDIEGLWLVKLSTVFTILEERVIFKGRLHTPDSTEISQTFNAQFTFWDGINNQFIIGIAPIAGRNYHGITTEFTGYGAIVYSPIDGSIKWWKNCFPTGIGVHTLPEKGSTYFQRCRDDVTISMYTKHGDYLGAALDVTDLGGTHKFDMEEANVREVWIENFVLCKTTLVAGRKDQKEYYPNIPEPTVVPREQRFAV